MEQTFNYCCNTTDSSDSEVLSANFPNIRMYNVKKALSNKPLDNTEGEWVSAIGENIIDFSAAGYFFAKIYTRSSMSQLVLSMLVGVQVIFNHGLAKKY